MNRSAIGFLGFLLTFSPQIFAAVQNVSGAATVTLDSNGVLDGVAFTGQAVTPSTLFVPANLPINTIDNLIGISSDSNLKSTVMFEGQSLIQGSVGISGGNALYRIQTGIGDLLFSSSVAASRFDLISNTVTLNGSLTLPTGASITTSFLDNTTFGNISLNGATTTTITAPVVSVVIDASQALNLNDGQTFAVVNSPSGTSNVPITVAGNNVRYAFSPNTPTGTQNGSVIIKSQKVPIATLISNKNGKSVGNALDAILPIAGAFPDTDLAFVETQLGLPTVAALKNAVMQISAAPGLMGVARESFNTVRQFQKVWLEHLQRYRAYTVMNECDQSLENELLRGCRVWGDVFGYYGHQSNKNNCNGYDVNTWGTVLAAEQPITTDLVAGAGFGYAYTHLDENIFGNHTHVHHYQGTGYFSYYPNEWFLEGGLSFGWSRYDGTRHINYNQVNRTARAKYNGQEYSGFLTTGYDCTYKNFEITPFGSLLYSYVHLNHYRESGARSLNLLIKRQNYQFMQSGLGLKVAYPYELCWGTLYPEIHTMWLHDFNRTTLNANATFMGLGYAGGTFHNRGYSADQNTWNIGASLSCLSVADFSVVIVYDYERSPSYFDHQGLIQLGYDF